MKYRNDIDGLRALAVFSVILFHLDFSFISGGFAGVDIFFVISGYLITKVIRSETDSGIFKISRFYLRRIRRIIPALFIVVITTLIFAIFYLPKSELQELFESVISVSTFSSNFFFLQNSGYFSTAAELKPLLHTWSLGIEEQFYILFPLIMWQLRNKSDHYLKIFLGLIILLSFSMSILPIALSHPVANFYLPITRFWELLIGSYIALMNIKQINNKLLLNGFSTLGFALIFYTFITLDSLDIFPGWNTVPVVIGTAMLILFGSQKSNLFSVVFSNTIIRQFGLISYSMYLWHWPIIALMKNSYQGEFLLIDKFLVVMAVIILSILSYMYVEQPFRVNPKFKNRLTIKSGLLSLLFLIFFNLMCYFILSINKNERLIPNKYQHAVVEQIKKDVCFSHSETLESTMRCSYGKKDSSKIFLVFGDSHVNALIHAINKAAVHKGWRVIMASNTGCPGLFGVYKAYNSPNALNCQGVYSNFIDEFLTENKNKIQKVLLISRWSMYQKGWIKNGRLQQATHFISDDDIVSKNAEDSAFVLKRALNRTVTKISQGLNIAVSLVMYAPILPMHINDMNQTSLNRSDYEQERRYIKEIFQELNQLPLVDVIDPIDSFCQEKCIISKNNNFLYQDESHLSVEGNMVFYPLIQSSLNK